MAKIGEQPSGALTRRKMMSSAVMLFFEKGYHNTTTAEIARRVGMSNSSFFRAFENKEAVLRAFVEYMFDLQFEKARNEEPLMVYAVETAVQMHTAEMNEQLRDLYVSAYSLPTTSEYIHRRTAEKLKRLFEEYMPDAEEQDFYEIDIATSGIARGYIVKPCSEEFTMEMKIRRYIRCAMMLYGVPVEVIEEITDKVVAMDLKTVAEGIVNEAMSRYKEEFEKVRFLKYVAE